MTDLQAVAGVKVSASPLMQCRLPVGGGPSSNMCPKCPPQRRQWHSVRVMKNEVSSLVPIAWGSDAQKLGQPVPDSNFVADEYTDRSQPAQWNVPLRFSWSNGLVPGRSVSSSLRTAYCASDRIACHSASVFATSKVSALASWTILVLLNLAKTVRAATAAPLASRSLRRFMSASCLPP